MRGKETTFFFLPSVPQTKKTNHTTSRARAKQQTWLRRCGIPLVQNLHAPQPKNRKNRKKYKKKTLFFSLFSPFPPPFIFVSRSLGASTSFPLERGIRKKTETSYGPSLRRYSARSSPQRPRQKRRKCFVFAAFAAATVARRRFGRRPSPALFARARARAAPPCLQHTHKRSGTLLPIFLRCRGLAPTTKLFGCFLFSPVFSPQLFSREAAHHTISSLLLLQLSTQQEIRKAAEDSFHPFNFLRAAGFSSHLSCVGGCKSTPFERKREKTQREKECFFVAKNEEKNSTPSLSRSCLSLSLSRSRGNASSPLPAPNPGAAAATASPLRQALPPAKLRRGPRGHGRLPPLPFTVLPRAVPLAASRAVLGPGARRRGRSAAAAAAAANSAPRPLCSPRSGQGAISGRGIRGYRRRAPRLLPLLFLL